MKATLTLTIIISFLAYNIKAWDVSGHMIVAQIAYERLNPTALAQVKKLSNELALSGQPLNAINVAAWADEIKHQHGGPYAGEFKNWHFIDLGCNPNDPDLLTHPPKMSIQNGDLVTALNRCFAVIKEHNQDPLITNDVIALALIMHLVGDIHQPLHCTAYYYAQAHVEPGHVRPEATDGGGNAITVSNFEDQYPELHEFWDVAYKTDFNTASGEITSEKDLKVSTTAPNSSDVKAWAQKIEAFAPDNSKSLEPDFKKWAQETHALGCQWGYDALGSDPETLPKTLTEKYAADGKRIASQQLCLAGYRLAQLLNELYPESP
jgi:hypothetical protein